ncbi:hypothetical protein NUACC21_37450 [Scytonema sp. NUACC21]
MEIRDLDYQQGYLEPLNDLRDERIVGGNGGVIVLSTTGTLLIADYTGGNTIQASNASFASITGSFPDVQISGGTLIQGIIQPR